MKQKIRNTSLVFLISGLWHGANWTYVVWGVLHALFFLPLLLGNRNRHNLNFSEWLSWKEGLQMASTFVLVCLAWVFFRAPSLGYALDYIKGIFTWSLFSLPQLQSIKPLAAIALLLVLEWRGRHLHFPLQAQAISRNSAIRLAAYFLLFTIIYFLGYTRSAIEFIYFQF